MKGFTLVELLVVITIIAILSVIGMTVFTSVQKNARDARRRADINAIAEALEVNKTATGYVRLDGSQFANSNIPATDPQDYPYCANKTANTTNITPTAWTTACAPAADFDPVSGDTTTPRPAPGTSWKVCAWLESGSAFCVTSRQ